MLFLKEPLTAAAALESVPAKPGVDEVHAGPGVLYFSRLLSKATQSRLRYIVAQPIYQSVTIRNFNTTRKLRELLEARAR